MPKRQRQKHARLGTPHFVICVSGTTGPSGQCIQQTATPDFYQQVKNGSYRPADVVSAGAQDSPEGQRNLSHPHRHENLPQPLSEMQT